MSHLKQQPKGKTTNRIALGSVFLNGKREKNDTLDVQRVRGRSKVGHGSLLRLCLRFQWRGCFRHTALHLQDSSSKPCTRHSSCSCPGTVAGCTEQTWFEPSTLLFVREGGTITGGVTGTVHRNPFSWWGSAISSHPPNRQHSTPAQPVSEGQERSDTVSHLGQDPKHGTEVLESIFGLSLTSTELVFRPCVF